MKKAFKYIANFPETYNAYGRDQWVRQHDDSIVIINCKSSAIYYPDHWTPLSMKCAFNGREYYKFPHTTYAVSDGNFLLLNEDNVYESYINSDSPTESFTLNFTRKNLKSLSAYISAKKHDIIGYETNSKISTLRVVEKLYPHTARTLGYINAIRNFYRRNDLDDNKLLEIFHFILADLVDLDQKTSMEIDRLGAKKRITREELYKRLHTVRDYLHSCFHEEVSLNDLAKISFLNSYYLLREFKKYFHVTPHQYLTRIRLQEAKRLLFQTRHSIVDVALRVGYNDAASFSKLFKRETGVSPMHLRK